MLYITLRPYGQRKGVYSSSQIRGGDHVNIRAEASEPARYWGSRADACLQPCKRSPDYDPLTSRTTESAGSRTDFSTLMVFVTT